MNNIEPHYPFYARPPNKVVRYYYKDFDDGVGHTAKLRIVVYINKHGKECEEVAQVIWDKK